MIDPLSTQQLLTHVSALARDIGPRPAGHPAEAQAREYIRRTLIDLGFDAGEIEDMPFPAPDTWGYLFAAPVVLTLAANGLGKIAGRVGKADRGRVEFVQCVSAVACGRFAPATARAARVCVSHAAIGQCVGADTGARTTETARGADRSHGHEQSTRHFLEVRQTLAADADVRRHVGTVDQWGGADHSGVEWPQKSAVDAAT